MYAKPVEWISSKGEKLTENVVIKAKIYIETIWGKVLQMKLINFKGQSRFLEKCFHQNNIF